MGGTESHMVPRSPGMCLHHTLAGSLVFPHLKPVRTVTKRPIGSHGAAIVTQHLMAFWQEFCQLKTRKTYNLRHKK